MSFQVLLARAKEAMFTSIFICLIMIAFDLLPYFLDRKTTSNFVLLSDDMKISDDTWTQNRGICSHFVLNDVSIETIEQEIEIPIFYYMFRFSPLDVQEPLKHTTTQMMLTDVEIPRNSYEHPLVCICKNVSAEGFTFEYVIETCGNHIIEIQYEGTKDLYMVITMLDIVLTIFATAFMCLTYCILQQLSTEFDKFSREAEEEREEEEDLMLRTLHPLLAIPA